MKTKENEKKEKYQGPAREIKKVWIMIVTVISIIIGALWTVSKRLVRRLKELNIGERTETIQTTALQRSAWILRRVLET